MPIATSPFPCEARAVSFALVINWNNVVLPLEANPISAALSMALRQERYQSPSVRAGSAGNGRQK
jgi:hypothetical protein